MRKLSRALDAVRFDAGCGAQSDGAWNRLYATSALGSRNPWRNECQLRVLSRNQFRVDEHEPVSDQRLPGIPDQTAGSSRAVQRGGRFASSHWKVRRLPYRLLVRSQKRDQTGQPHPDRSQRDLHQLPHQHRLLGDADDCRHPRLCTLEQCQLLTVPQRHQRGQLRHPRSGFQHRGTTCEPHRHGRTQLRDLPRRRQQQPHITGIEHRQVHQLGLQPQRHHNRLRSLPRRQRHGGHLCGGPAQDNRQPEPGARPEHPGVRELPHQQRTGDADSASRRHWHHDHLCGGTVQPLWNHSRLRHLPRPQHHGLKLLRHQQDHRHAADLTGRCQLTPAKLHQV